MLKFSLEFFPNNIHKIFKNFKNKISLKPEFISITYHKNKINLKYVNLIKTYHNNLYPHVCFVNLSYKQIYFIINYYYIINIKGLVLLKGDNVSEKLYYSYNLNFFIKKNFINYFYIYNGIYTDVHPQSFNLISDIKNNIIKNNFNNYFITQYFYNFESFLFHANYIKKKKLIPAFIINNSIKQLIKFSNICKSNIPLWIIRNINNESTKIFYWLNLNFNLIANYIFKFLNFKILKFHFYTINNYILTNKLLLLLLNNINV